MLHTKFQLVPEKKIFEGFLPYMNMTAILVIQQASYYKIVISMYLKANIQNLFCFVLILV